MNLHEYQAKSLFAQYGLPVSEGYAVDTADEAVAAAQKIGGDRWVVKVQVHAGGRGKGGWCQVGGFSGRNTRLCRSLDWQEPRHHSDRRKRSAGQQDLR